MTYEFIEPLEEKPVLGKRVPHKCLAFKILQEFQVSKARYAKVNLDKIRKGDEGETVLDCVICMTICEPKNLSFTFPKLGSNVRAYSDKENIYLEKV